MRRFKALFILTLAIAGGVFLQSCDDAPSDSLCDEQTVSEIEARALYTRKCSLCHGADGKLGAAKATDLSQSTLSMKRRLASITYGKGSMPGQKGQLTRCEIEAIARYIERFRD